MFLDIFTLEGLGNGLVELSDTRLVEGLFLSSVGEDERIDNF